MEPQPTHTMTRMAPHTTWEIPTLQKVAWYSTFKASICCWMIRHIETILLNVCHSRGFLQHHPCAAYQVLPRGNAGGGHRSLFHSRHRQDQSLLLPQLWWDGPFNVTIPSWRMHITLKVWFVKSNVVAPLFSHVEELRGVHRTAYQDQPAEGCDRQTYWEGHQRQCLLGTQTRHHLSPDWQKHRKGETGPSSILVPLLWTWRVVHLWSVQAKASKFQEKPNLISVWLSQLSSVKYHTNAMSTFHQINAFEENGFLVMDMCVSDDGQAINNYMVQNLRKSGKALDEVSPADRGHFINPSRKKNKKKN